MTLRQYTPEDIDSVALRMIDIAAALRLMGKQAQEKGMCLIELHDKKLLEWLENIEHWQQRTSALFQVQLHSFIAEQQEK